MEEVFYYYMQQGGLCHHHPLHTFRHGKLTLPGLCTNLMQMILLGKTMNDQIIKVSSSTRFPYRLSTDPSSVGIWPVHPVAQMALLETDAD